MYNLNVKGDGLRTELRLNIKTSMTLLLWTSSKKKKIYTIHYRKCPKFVQIKCLVPKKYIYISLQISPTFLMKTFLDKTKFTTEIFPTFY